MYCTCMLMLLTLCEYKCSLTEGISVIRIVSIMCNPDCNLKRIIIVMIILFQNVIQNVIHSVIQIVIQIVFNFVIIIVSLNVFLHVSLSMYYL